MGKCENVASGSGVVNWASRGVPEQSWPALIHQVPVVKGVAVWSAAGVLTGRSQQVLADTCCLCQRGIAVQHILQGMVQLQQDVLHRQVHKVGALLHLIHVAIPAAAHVRVLGIDDVIRPIVICINSGGCMTA